MTRACLHMIFSAVGLEILSMPCTRCPGKIALVGNFLGVVRNVRVKISNRLHAVRKVFATTPQLLQRKDLL